MTNDFSSLDWCVMNDKVCAIQRHYPQIYLACHTRHRRARSDTLRLSGHDSSVLAHLDEATPTRPAELARHLGVSPSTLSATLKRLAGLRYVRLERRSDDKRRIDVVLTGAGSRAMQGSSVLETARVERLLARLTHEEQEKALLGLELLARAAGETMIAAGDSPSETRPRSSGGKAARGESA